MALNRTKVLEAAQKYLGKAQYDKAIVEYKKLVEADPRDVRTWLKIGDLYTRKGSRSEACDTYGRVASHYADQGFFLKAVAVYKQILKLEPGRVEIVTGANLPMLIKFANLDKQVDLAEAAACVARQGRESVQVASELLDDQTGEADEDGS